MRIIIIFLDWLTEYPAGSERAKCRALSVVILVLLAVLFFTWAFKKAGLL